MPAPDHKWHICDATARIEGLGGACVVKCELPGNHEGEHRADDDNCTVTWEQT